MLMVMHFCVHGQKRVMSVDSSYYSRFPYIRFVENDSLAWLSKEDFIHLAGKVVFPVNKYDLPSNDSLLHELMYEVIPRINADSLELYRVMIHGTASPEGPLRGNKILAQQRSAALRDFFNSRLAIPLNEQSLLVEIDIEDYRSLCIMMAQADDPDYAYVKSLCDQYLPQNDITTLKSRLQQYHRGQLWRRLLKSYYPQLRASRIFLFAKKPAAPKDQQPEPDSLQRATATRQSTVGTSSKTEKVPPPPPVCDTLRLSRREVLAVKSNLLLDVAYVPGYDRWCPIPNVAIEYFPLHGHFTYGASFDCPWWRDYGAHKFFQMRNYQVETRYYLRSGDILRNTPGEGAAFRGLYLQGYVHGGLFEIGFNADKGWKGEGIGAGVGIGYVTPLSRKGHWRMEVGVQVGWMGCRYDPFQYENLVNPNYRDHRYYYRWTESPDLFKKRQYRFNWIGPTRAGITLSYDLLYRRTSKRGASLKPYEDVIQERRNEP